MVGHLPPFPAHSSVHHGAWLLADEAPIPAGARTVELAAVRFDLAPPWIDRAAVRQMLARVTERILVPDGMWPVEVAYTRARPEAQGRPDEVLLAERLPEWQANLAEARAALPAGTWRRFYADAERLSVGAVTRYLRQA